MFVSTVMLITSFYVEGITGAFEVSHNVFADNSITEYFAINSLEELYDFSNNYSTNTAFAEQYKTAELDIDINEVWVLEVDHSFGEGDPKTFTPIGTSANPFMGRVKITQTDGSIVAIQSTMPFFDVVYDSVEIWNQDSSVQSLSIIRTDTMSGNVPLFANEVQNDSRSGATSATWDIMASPYVDESNDYAHDFSGIIGTINENATVNLALDFAACATNHNANIVSDSSIGLACGVMAEGSTLNFYLKGSSDHALRTGYSVTTSGAGKSAGSLVGEMGFGTNLNLYLSPESNESLTYYDFSASKTISATGADSYAGGLVGKIDGGDVRIYRQASVGDNDPSRIAYVSQDVVSAGEAAGGIFGSYIAKEDINFNDYFGASGCSVSAKNAGGFAGVFDGAGYNISFTGTDSSNHLSVVAAVSGTRSVENFGVLLGKYVSNSLTPTLDIEHVSITFSKTNNPGGTAYGGLIGYVDGGGAAVYVKADDISVTASSGHGTATYFGGLFGKTGDKGSLLDVGSFKLTTNGDYKGGAVVGYIDRGVVRLSGHTDLTQANGNTADGVGGSNSRGQLVGRRGGALIYALGTGEEESASYGNGWRFERYTNDQYVDDIGTWGEVVRLNDSSSGSLVNIEGSSVLTYDATAHTVTIAGPVFTMASKEDVVKTALNIQLNTGDYGALCFSDSTNRNTVLLSSNELKVNGEISLSGTGITSLTRDDGYNAAFSGTLSGLTGNSTDKIILATGERYGIFTEGKAGAGEIYAHQYNGLFAKIGGGTISNLTIEGSITCNSNVGSVYIGGVAADVTNGITVSNIVLNESINYKGISGSDHFVGGLAGQVDTSNTSAVSVSSSTISPTITAGGSLGQSLKIAGLISFVNSTSSFNISVSDSTRSYKVDGTSATSTYSDLRMAGLIADIKYNGNSSSADTRKVILSGNTFSGCEVKNKASVKAGGILGHSWFNTDTELTNNTFSSTNTIWTNATDVSAICYKATGYWKINSKGLKVDSLEIKSGTGETIETNHVSVFGFVVNRGYHEDGANISSLYLETQASDSYTLDTSGVVVPVMTSGTYDEFVAFSGKEILENNCGVISICLPAAFKMDGTECNSYQNVFNTTLSNSNSRYYYNVADHKSSNDDGWKLLLWSLNKYASTNIKRCFTNPFSNNTITGTFNMNGISYYPIDIPSGETITLGNTSSTTTFTFYNSEIEQAEDVSSANGNTDGLKRSTISDSQHYLMHSGLFKNVNGTINAVGAVTFSGSVGMNNSYSGVLINRSLNGNVTTTSGKNISFNNLSLSGANGATDDNGYLFIHAITANSSLTLNSVRIIGYANDGSTYASSLIGDVSGNDINLRFDDLKIDARNATGATNLTDLTNVYGTGRSIFKNATLLNKFDTNANSVAIYNFDASDDWTGSSHTPGNVTYGRELTDSVEYLNLEKKYYASSDDNRPYINPVSTPTTTIYSAGFSSDFLPYVRYFTSSAIAGYTQPSVNAEISYREIKVNVLSTNLDDGCGTYDHPYIITNAKQLQDIATMINGGSNLQNICLPKTVSLHSDSSYDHFCLDSNNDHTCTDTYSCPSGSSTYTSTDGGQDWTAAQVREYLCGAYYQIQGEITLNSFVGLGAADNNTDGRYAFRGVIVGASGAKINNNSNVPLIKVSNGSVVRNLTIEINTTNNVATTASTSTAFGYSTSKNMYYGGVIGEIMGGDNIIDNVRVNYSNYLRVGTTGQYLYTIGGYVGVVVNGGLIFRNMPANPLNNQELTDGSFLVGSSSAGSSYSRSSDTKHLYINSFVGRVINGYAINETNSYSGDTGSYTLDNSNKNYRIADVNKAPGSNIISFGDFTATNANDKLCIPNGQSLFILSLITQSGAGSAPTADGTYAYSIGYDGTTKYDGTSAVSYAATHLATYEYVGNVNSDEARSDWTQSCRDRVNSKTCVPYIISKYTLGSGESYLARTVTSRTYLIELTTSNGDYKLPECFRGIGSICKLDGMANGAVTEVPSVSSSDLADEDGKYVMKIYGLKGNDSKIWINLNYKTYSNLNDNYI